MKSRYATKMVDNRFYARITIPPPPLLLPITLLEAELKTLEGILSHLIEDKHSNYNTCLICAKIIIKIRTRLITRRHCL